MKPFMNEDFLLHTQTAKTLYHEVAAKMPVIDYHCHISPQEIAENRTFGNITQLWLEGDHYKWRLMRANGVPEEYITGNASDYDKFLKWAAALEKAIGNPIYHWCHLELQRYFGYTGVLNSKTADEVWTLCNEKLQNGGMDARSIMSASHVDLVCTTDDPADSLIWHKAIADDPTFSVIVLPAFRPDNAADIEKDSFCDYIRQLEAAAGMAISDFASLKEALIRRMDSFAAMGCRTADHGMFYAMYRPAEEATADSIFRRRLAGETLTGAETLSYKTAFLQFCAAEYHRRDWVMQLHYGVKRNNNTRMLQAVGINTGFDCISNYTPASELADLLNSMEEKGTLPKTVLYSLNPIDNTAIDSIIGCFQSDAAIGRIQHGSAWWFNDNKQGMTEHLTTLASQSLLANFIGMLTDSRSFVSYTRHEYFRRILCDLIGTWVEDGEFPADMDALRQMVADISYNNTARYFAFPLRQLPVPQD